MQYYACSVCGYVHDGERGECPACASEMENQAALGEFPNRDAAYIYYHTQVDSSDLVNYHT
jgi:predicted ATP-dependent serine protease